VRAWCYVQTQLSLRETTDTLNDRYMPAVVVISPHLRIHAAYNGYWYWDRPTHDELVRDLRHISRELRPGTSPHPGASLPCRCGSDSLRVTNLVDA
jgi:hypothetical protein